MFRLVLLAICGLWTAGVGAQPDSTLAPRSLFFQEKDIHDIQLSRNGQRVYYQRHSEGNQALLYVTATAPGEEKTLRFSGRLLSWRPTHLDQLLLFVLDAENRRRLLLAGEDGKIIRDLTPFPLRNLQLEALSINRPESVAVWLVAEEVSKDGSYVIDMTTGAGERISPNLGFDERYFDGDLRLVAASRANASGGRTIFSKEGEGWRELVAFSYDEGMLLGGLQRVVSVSYDGRRLYLTDNSQSDKTVLVEYRLDTAARRVLVADRRVDILPFGAIVGSDGWPQMVLGVWAQPIRHFLNGETRRDVEWLDQQLDGQASFADRSADGRTWLVRRLDGGPTQYYLFHRGRRELLPLFNDYPALDGVSPAERHAFTVRTRDGVELPIHVYLPPGVDKDHNGIPDTTLPTILYVHGGPWVGVTHWNNWFHTRNFQFLASRGYAVINTEFRGTTGLGKEITRLGDQKWGTAMHYDLVDIAAWAVRERIADTKRMAVWGWSYGGYAAAAALAFAPERFVCGLAMYGPADLLAFSSIPFTDNDRWRATVGNPRTQDGAELLRAQSPFYHPEKISNPLLLTTGSRDERVPQSQVDTFASVLAREKKRVIYFYYPEEGHDYQAPESWRSYWAIAERFLHDQLGGRYQAAGADLDNGKLVVVYGQEFVAKLKEETKKE